MPEVLAWAGPGDVCMRVLCEFFDEINAECKCMRNMREKCHHEETCAKFDQPTRKTKHKGNHICIDHLFTLVTWVITHVPNCRENIQFGCICCFSFRHRFSSSGSSGSSTRYGGFCLWSPVHAAKLFNNITHCHLSADMSNAAVSIFMLNDVEQHK